MPSFTEIAPLRTETSFCYAFPIFKMSRLVSAHGFTAQWS